MLTLLFRSTEWPTFDLIQQTKIFFNPIYNFICYTHDAHRESEGGIQSHHSPEELPVAKVHLHLFLQLVQVALGQHPTIYISLPWTRKRTDWFVHCLIEFLNECKFRPGLKKCNTISWGGSATGTGEKLCKECERKPNIKYLQCIRKLLQ